VAAVIDHFSRIGLFGGVKGFLGQLMKSSIVKRSIVIDGHKTSVSLEDPFWTDLKEIAHTQQATLSELVAKIDAAREAGNRSSAIRLFVLQHFRNGDKRMEVEKARLSAGDAERTPASWP
jgi:predicted DNA-binding ribbon-helix-helix protein